MHEGNIKKTESTSGMEPTVNKDHFRNTLPAPESIKWKVHNS